MGSFTNKVHLPLQQEDVTTRFIQSTFPAGEACVRLPEFNIDSLNRNTPVRFTVKKQNVFNLPYIAQHVDLLRRRGFTDISLVLPYLPYSRQDRYTTDRDSFALKQYAKLINTLGFSFVYTVDAHSDVCGVIDNLVDLSPRPIIDEILSHYIELPLILLPDAGAAKKFENLAPSLAHNDEIKTVVARKHRDLRTGKITGIEVEPIVYRDVLIIDDICDGGATFIALRDKLQQAAKVDLYVTHGIFSKPDVFDAFRWVISTDSVHAQNSAENHITLTLDHRIPR